MDTVDQNDDIDNDQAHELDEQDNSVDEIENEAADQSDDQEEVAESMVDAVTKAVSGETDSDKLADKSEDDQQTDDSEKDLDEKPGTLTKEDLMTVPVGLKPNTERRMKTLIGKLEENDSIIDRQTQMLTGFQNMIKSTGASPEEFNELVQFAANSRGDENAKRQALVTAKSIINKLSLELGESVDGADPLAGYDDLREAVEDMSISEQYAMEIARNRNQQQANQKEIQTQQNQQHKQEQQYQSQQEYQSRVQKGAEAIDKLTKKWQNNDIDYGAKEAALQREAEKIATTMEPEQWEYAMELAYKSVAQKPAPRNKNYPLRPTGGAAGKKQPTSMLDAVNGALGG